MGLLSGKIDNIAEINLATLKFRDVALEQAFQDDFFERTKYQLRYNILLGIFLYGILGVIDYLIIPNSRSQAWFIRYCIACPSALAILSLTFTRFFQNHMQSLLITGGLVASAGAVGLNLLVPPTIAQLYFTGILLCLIYYYTFVGMRFTTAAILSWSTFILYELAVSWKTEIPVPVRMHNTLVLLAFNLTGMWGSYLREWYRMADFVHRQTIIEQKNQIHDTLKEVEIARKNAEEISRLDPLTSLFNRRHFFSVANHEVERAGKHPACLSLIIFDIDHFKRINDSFGHNAGDIVLLRITDITRKTVRDSDIVCRYGGEEFVILLPETDLRSAVTIADRLRETIASTEVSAGSQVIRVTVSVGIAVMAESGQGDLEELLKQADLALYRAKSEGRNQVKIWQPEIQGYHANQ